VIPHTRLRSNLSASMHAASLHGMVAASFSIEQSGLPRLTRRDETRELWNGEDPLQRLRDMIKLTEMAGDQQEFS
jgi:hypothetical protein